MPAVVVPHAVGPEMAAALRDDVAGAGYTRYDLLDRGSYEVAEEPPLGDLRGVLSGIASEVVGRPLAVRSLRVLRLAPGDYLLVRHDRVHDDRPVELVLDLSPGAVPGAEVHYRHRGQVYFVVPSAPGSLAIVERGPSVMCNHTYLSRRRPEASVVRLVALAITPPT